MINLTSREGGVCLEYTFCVLIILKNMKIVLRRRGECLNL